MACYTAGVKIEPRQVEAFLRKPDPKIRAVVVYGNDDGLVAERGTQLAKTVCDDLKDPFRVVDISGEALKGDPARLADEFGAMSLMGGRRVIRVRPAGDESATALENLVAATAGDALIVLEAGNLTPRSALRALAETEPMLGAMPCYMDSDEALEGLVESSARAAGLAVEPDALDWIVERLGGDRGQTRSEIDKLLLYKAGDVAKTITLGDATAVLGDTAAIGIDDVIAATFDGELVGARPRPRPRVRRGRQSGPARALAAAPCRPAPPRCRPCQGRQLRRRDVQGAQPAARRADTAALRAPPALMALAAVGPGAQPDSVRRDRMQEHRPARRGDCPPAVPRPGAGRPAGAGPTLAF